MRPLFWLAVVCVMALFIPICNHRMGYLDDGMASAAIEEMDSAHPARGTAFYRAAADALAAYLRGHGFTPIPGRPNKRGAMCWFGPGNWFEMSDGSRVWVVISQRDEWTGKGPKVVVSGREVKEIMEDRHVDAGLSVWVSWPYRAWDIGRLAAQAHGIDTELKQWWRNYLAEHAQSANEKAPPIRGGALR